MHFDDASRPSETTKRQAAQGSDPAAGMREALEELLLAAPAVVEVQFRHAVQAVIHLTVDAPHGRPASADEFLARLDATWLLRTWGGHDRELSMIATLAAGDIPALSWCELMYTTAMAPWSSSQAAVAARRIFATADLELIPAARNGTTL